MRITLNKKKIDKFAAFIRKHDLDQWFMAKDDGAYIGATGGNVAEGTFENILFYFAGCDPKKNPDSYWETARDRFGGDDFGEHFPATEILKAADDPKTHSLTVSVTPTEIKISRSIYT